MTPRLLGTSRLLGVLALLLGLAPLAAAASPYAYYAERQRGDTLIIEHTPAPGILVRRVARERRVVRHRVVRHRAAIHRPVRHRIVRRVTRVRNVANPAIAGFCREGGAVRRRLPVLGERIVQREVCDSVAWYSQNPNDLVVRPPEYAAENYERLARSRLPRPR